MEGRVIEMTEMGLTTTSAVNHVAPGSENSDDLTRRTGMANIEEHASWPVLRRLPMTLRARIPLHRFTVRGLVELKVGQVVESAWPAMDDVPLKVGAVHLSWCEFEVVDQQIAVRLTQLA
jgi:flagellar motor switch protein FliM